jgi:3-oxoacyl-[acyl-carrier-protein] synthase II
VVKSHFSLTGPSANVAAACATGVAAIETAASWIRSGQADVVLAGAAEASLSPFYRAGFSRLGVLAPGADPRAARPFDRDRAGFAMGEGAAVLVLESEEFCRARGGRPLARLLATALRQSSRDAIQFDDNGRDVGRVIAAALAGHAAPSYVNAHGTGTVLNDAAEARAFSHAFSDGATWIGSTKASTGHLLGAAGAVEAAFAALAVAENVMPPSIHLATPDALCAFPLVRAARPGVRSALSLSYGFGGQMGAVLFGRS